MKSGRYWLVGTRARVKAEFFHRVPDKGSLEVIEQPDEPIGRLIRARKQSAYLDDYCSLLETMHDLDLNSSSQAIKAQGAHYWLDAMREEIG